MLPSKVLRLSIAFLLFAGTALAQKTPVRYADGELLVRFRAATPASRMSRAHAKRGGRVLRSYRQLSGVQRVKLPAGTKVEDAIRDYRLDPNVLYAEPNYVVEIQATPNDPLYPSLWGMTAIGAEQAWDIITGSSDVVVGVIDTGVDYTHPDLAANMHRNSADCDADGVDDDGNGYADDCYGIDTYNDDSNPMDDHAHGTHVAGTIAAAGNNGVGVAGVGWNTGLIACKFLGPSGSGLLSDALTCMDYLAELKDRGVNIVATNNSWGSTTFKVVLAVSATLRDAVRLHMEKGILFIVAATNEAGDNDLTNPTFMVSTTELPNVISVAAVDELGKLAWFSNFGRHSVHLAAPGVRVLSTVIPSRDPSGYASFNGTSMATPHVAGAVALLKAWNPALSWHQLKNLILTGGTPSVEAEKTVSQRTLNVYGSMTCTDTVLQERVRPTASGATVDAGTMIRLEMLHIRCGEPNGAGQVTVNPGGVTIDLKDDGLAPDEFAGDGVYSGEWAPPGLGTYTLSFPNGDDAKVYVLEPYRFAASTETVRVISGTSLDLSLRPFETKEITPPFPLQFGGASFPSIFVGADGTLSLGQPWTDIFNDPLPSVRANNVVAPLWMPLMAKVGTQSNVFWQVLGTEPERELVIEFRNMLTGSSGDPESQSVTFQTVFFENKPDILFLYPDVVFGGERSFADNASYATIGIQAAPSTATQFSFNRPGAVVNGDALLWTLAGGTSTTPVLAALAPPSTVRGSADLTVTVTGQNFMPDTVVRYHDWDRPTLATTYVSATELRALLPASRLGTEGSTWVTAYTPGKGESNPLVFTIEPSPTAPRVTGVNPPRRSGGSGATTVTVLGNRFDSTSRVQIVGTVKTPVLVSANELRVSLAAADLNNPGIWGVVVMNATESSNGGTFIVSGFEFRNSGSEEARVRRGETATYHMTIVNTWDVFDQPVQFSCAGLPALTTCEFTPASLTPGGLQFVSLAVRTTAPATASASRSSPQVTLALLTGFSLPAVVLAGAPWTRRRRRLALLAVIFLLAALLISCGGGGGGGTQTGPNPPPPAPPPPPATSTPLGTHTITLQGTAGGLRQSFTVRLIVE